MLLYIAGGHKLWEVEKRDWRMIHVRCLCVYISDHAVGGAKVDTNDITRSSHAVKIVKRNA